MSRNAVCAILLGVSAMMAHVETATATGIATNAQIQLAGTYGGTVVSQGTAGTLSTNQSSGSSRNGASSSATAKCSKYMKKALRTGRHIWWARYRKCLHNARK